MLFNAVLGKQCSQHSPAGGCGQHHSRTGWNIDDNVDQYGANDEIDEEEEKDDDFVVVDDIVILAYDKLISNECLYVCLSVYLFITKVTFYMAHCGIYFHTL